MIFQETTLQKCYALYNSVVDIVKLNDKLQKTSKILRITNIYL